MADAAQDATTTPCRRLATFWHGSELPRLDRCCLLSFVRAGFEVTLYAFRTMPELPTSLRVADAREIAPEDHLHRFLVGGRPSLAHFADYFRYRLFERTDAAWIDTDLLCLKPFDIPSDRHFLTRETERSLNNAIIRMVPGNGLLEHVVGATTAMLDRPMAWGATGPALITGAVAPGDLESAWPPAMFYPFHWTEWWKPFLPEQRDWCEARSLGSNAVHLWNNIVARAGYWRDLAPPRGSFLYERLASLELVCLFRDVMPVSVMEAIVTNDTNLRTADHMPMTDLSRALVSRARRKLRGSAFRGGASG